MKKTISYFLKKRIRLIVIITIVLLLIAVLSMHKKAYIEYYYDYVTDNSIKGPGTSPFAFLATIGAILSIFMPIYEFGFKMKKISIDQMYSLPIKREKLYLSKFIAGFITILIPITILYLDLFINVAVSEHMFEMIYFLPYYFVLVFVMLMTYSMYSFFFTRANTLVDGIVNMFALTFVLALFILLLDEIACNIGGGLYVLWYPFTFIVDYFNNKISETGLKQIDRFDPYEVDSQKIIALMIVLVIAIVCAVLFVLLNKKEKAENCMQVSNSWFSYRTIIPAYLSMFLLLMIMTGAEFFSMLFVCVAAYIAYIAYRRSFKIKKCDYIVLVVTIVASFIVGVVLSELILPNIGIIHY